MLFSGFRSGAGAAPDPELEEGTGRGRRARSDGSIPDFSNLEGARGAAKLRDDVALLALAVASYV